MKSRATIGCGVLLAAGVLANIAVALGCTFHAQWRPGPMTQPPPFEAEELALRHLDREPPPVAFGAWTERVGYRELLISAFGIREKPHHLSIMEVRAGLPLSSLRRDRAWEEDIDTWTRRHSGRGLAVASSRSSTPIVPLTPVWPGFAVNSLFFALLFLLLAMPWQIRRLARLRRGLCTGCGYPMGTGTVCSECGRELEPTGPDLTFQ